MENKSCRIRLLKSFKFLTRCDDIVAGREQAKKTLVEGSADIKLNVLLKASSHGPSSHRANKRPLSPNLEDSTNFILCQSWLLEKQKLYWPLHPVCVPPVQYNILGAAEIVIQIAQFYIIWENQVRSCRFGEKCFILWYSTYHLSRLNYFSPSDEDDLDLTKWLKPWT